MFVRSGHLWPSKAIILATKMVYFETLWIQKRYYSDVIEKFLFESSWCRIQRRIPKKTISSPFPGTIVLDESWNECYCALAFCVLAERFNMRKLYIEKSSRKLCFRWLTEFSKPVSCARGFWYSFKTWSKITAYKQIVKKNTILFLRINWIFYLI